jgi:parallel beta-helix repeat protein
MSSAMEIAMKDLSELIAAAASPQSAIDALKAETTTKLFNVMTGYEAKGDGVTNDNASIQSAIDAASLAGGGTVLFPYMSTEYMISGLTVPANVRLWGFGSKLKLIDGSNADMIRVTGDNVLIEGLELDGNKLNQTTATVRGIAGNSLSDNVTIQNCVIRNTKYDGIYASDSSVNWKIVFNKCYSNGRFGIGLGSSTNYVLVSGNYVESSISSGINLVGNGVGVTISNNHTKDTGEDGFAGYNFQNTDLLVTGNTFINPGNNGTHVGGTRGVVVSNNVFVTPAQYGIYFSNNDASILSAMVCNGNYIKNPASIHSIYLSNVNGGTIGGNTCDGTAVGQGISLNTSQNISVSGNTIKDCAGTGIRVVNSFENTIIGNNVDTCADGIRLNDTGTACINNTIVGNKVMNGTGVGIVTQNLSDYNIVTNNIIRSNLGGNISLAGVNNVNANNITA